MRSNYEELHRNVECELFLVHIIRHGREWLRALRHGRSGPQEDQSQIDRQHRALPLSRRPVELEMQRQVGPDGPPGTGDAGDVERVDIVKVQ